MNHRFKIRVPDEHQGGARRQRIPLPAALCVATNDAEPDPEVADRLSEYYAAKGTPPGRWRGSGLAGLHSDTAQPGHEITADQMAALYGEGLHPDADAMIDNGVALKGCKLGRAYGIYTGGSAMLADLAKQEKSFRDTHGRRPDEAERSDIATRVGFDHYAAAHHGASPTSAREVLAWVNSTQDNVRQAVAGFDLTFSPVKSVSVLWALADKDTAGIIAAAHHAAVADALSWVENNALFTRVGVNGIQQLKTNGLVASEFTHFDTRAGDPDLHSHVLVSNKVQVADTPEARKAGKIGEWKTIDGSHFFEHWTDEGKLYLCAIRDASSGRIVGTGRVHSDGGGQFRDGEFLAALEGHRMVGSMGRSASCGDNAAMESFSPCCRKTWWAGRSGPPGGS
ncbi:MobF family relaxase [Corynebacterium neomassiliense]|uniref:MobF family relaxase n=1 Tax=Corynebacterium neomassiliense TaxID=2079482 RepID=UPI00102F4A8B